MGVRTVLVMELDDLDWQMTNYGGVGPKLARLLVEQGHLDVVMRAAAERGEWYCAQEALRALCARGEFQRARSVIEPFVAIGSSSARNLDAEVLIEWGRIGEGLSLVRPGDLGKASDGDCIAYAELLVKAGLVDEAIDVLAPRVRSWWIASSLVEVTDKQGRDDRVLRLLEPLAVEARQAASDCARDRDLSSMQELHAMVLERVGRADEAIRLLGADFAAGRFPSQNILIYYARLLARHDRLGELRDLATGSKASVVLEVYADALRDRGRAEEAEALVREFIAVTGCLGHRAYLSRVLLADGRVDDSVEVAEPAFGFYDCSNLLVPLVYGLLDRPQELLRVLDHPSVKAQEDHEEYGAWWRPTALASLGRHEEAIDLLTRSRDKSTDHDTMTAHLLHLAGHTDMAIAHLRTVPSLKARQDLGELLIQLGRADEGLAVLPTVAEQRAAQQAKPPVAAAVDDNGYSVDPPF